MQLSPETLPKVRSSTIKRAREANGGFRGEGTKKKLSNRSLVVLAWKGNYCFTGLWEPTVKKGILNFVIVPIGGVVVHSEVQVRQDVIESLHEHLR